jgi:class 3 adenylate cyclase
MKNLPARTVTFLFTDIEDSTQLWERHPQEMKSVLARHDAILRNAIQTNSGRMIKTTGDGAHAVFSTALDAINACAGTQIELQTSSMDLPIKVRIGLHTGDAELRDGDYYGQALNRAARIMSIGHGGPILLSETTAQVARERFAERHNSAGSG